MGFDTLKPFLDRSDKGVIILAARRIRAQKTSRT